MSSKLINGVYVKDGIYFTTGGLYQSTLSNQNYIDIKKTIKSTKKRYVSISTKLRNTCCFTTREELEEVCKVDKKSNNKIDKSQKIKEDEFLRDSDELVAIKTLPIVCPLGLYIIENYTPLQRKKENCIVAIKLGDIKKNNIIEPVYAAITIFNDSLYFIDKNGEFVGSESDLLIYIKKIKSKIILNSIHSTEECFQKIEDTFFNDTFTFKRIGIDSKDIKNFKYSSKDVFFSRKALSSAEKIHFYDFNEKEEKLKKIGIVGGISFIVLSILSYTGYYYYSDYMEKKAAEEAARIEASKPKVIPNLNFNTLDYFESYCFSNLDKFSAKSTTWALKTIKCDPKGIVYTASTNTDLGNYLTNKNDFYKVYDVESKDYSKFKFDTYGKNVAFTPSGKFVGIKANKVFKYSEKDMREYVSYLTLDSNTDFKFKIIVDVNKSNLKSWELNSTYSPMYLQENYHLFNKLYINLIELSVDQTTGIFNWKITGVF